MMNNMLRDVGKMRRDVRFLQYAIFLVFILGMGFILGTVLAVWK